MAELLNPSVDHVLQTVVLQAVRTRDNEMVFVANFTNNYYFSNQISMPYTQLQIKHSISLDFRSIGNVAEEAIAKAYNP